MKPTTTTQPASGFAIALIGADGSGKTTVARQLELALPELRYVYMGVNPKASNIMLPTTKAWFRLKEIARKPTHQGGPPAILKKKPGLFGQLKSLLRLLLIIPEEVYRSRYVERLRRSDHIILLDRDYYADFYFHDIQPYDNRHLSLARKLHGWYLRNHYRQPDMFVLLDAPAAVLRARKQEGSLQELEQRQSEYQQLGAHVSHFYRIDVRQPVSQVVTQIVELIQTRSTVS